MNSIGLLLARSGVITWSLISPTITHAHLSDGNITDKTFFFHFDPLTVMLLLLFGFFYFRGSRQLRQRDTLEPLQLQHRIMFFWIGWTTLVVALVSPVDTLGEVLFSAHMIQHELLMLIAAPLLILARPGSAIVLGAKYLFIPLIRSVSGNSNSIAAKSRKLLSPLPAWTLHFIGLWAWHIPALFNAGLSSNLMHTTQHISFMCIALVFWYSILRSDKHNSMTAVISLFTTAIHASVLGALLTFSPVIWYAPYTTTTQAWGLTPLEDQQLGGLIMWMPAGIAFIVAALIILAKVLQERTGEVS